MAQKDIAQKLLEDYEDVFADIINVLVFDGEEVVRPNALEASNLHQRLSDQCGRSRMAGRRDHQ